MNAEFGPLRALFLVAWFVAGGFAVRPFLRERHPRFRHWLLLIVGVVMLAGGAFTVAVTIRVFFL